MRQWMAVVMIVSGVCVCVFVCAALCELSERAVVGCRL